MEAYTNTGLVNHAKTALNLKTIYMWGGILRLVEKQYDALKTYYEKTPGTGYTPARWTQLKALFGKNVYGVDCVGLIKSYLWSGKTNGGTGSPKYGQSGYPPDINANLMYQRATEKGPINTMPEIPGLIVYCKSHPHAGIYIGNGETIESTLGTRGDGVVKRKLDGLWEFWFKCPYISYSTAESTAITAGCKVKIKSSADMYAGTNTKIPQKYKGVTYTVSKVTQKKALIKELYSWVQLTDLERV